MLASTGTRAEASVWFKPARRPRRGYRPGDRVNVRNTAWGSVTLMHRCECGNRQCDIWIARLQRGVDVTVTEGNILRVVSSAIAV